MRELGWALVVGNGQVLIDQVPCPPHTRCWVSSTQCQQTRQTNNEPHRCLIPSSYTGAPVLGLHTVIVEFSKSLTPCMSPQACHQSGGLVSGAANHLFALCGARYLWWCDRLAGIRHGCFRGRRSRASCCWPGLVGRKYKETWQQHVSVYLSLAQHITRRHRAPDVLASCRVRRSFARRGVQTGGAATRHQCARPA